MTTSRTKCTPAPTTATEARELPARQRQAREHALFAEYENSLATVAADAAQRRDRAIEAWTDAVNDPDVGIDGLFAAWSELRTASAVRAGIVRSAGTALDVLVPLRSAVSGQPIQRRPDSLDALRSALFSDALERAISARADNAVAAAMKTQSTAVAAAADAAAAKA